MRQFTNTIVIVGSKKYQRRHFYSIEDHFKNTLKYIDSYLTNEILEVQPDLIIVSDEHYCELGNLIATCKSLNILTLQVMDGILEWRRTWENMLDGNPVNELRNPLNQPAFAHKIACLGYKDLRILESWGNFGKCEIVGLPRLKQIQNLRSDFSHLKEKKGKILIATAKTPAFTVEQERTTLESLKDLRDYFQVRRDIEVIWRVTGNLTQKLGITNNLTDLSGKEIHEIIQQVDAVITTPSTTLIEAMVLKTPVALLDYYNTPHYFETAWNIYAQNHISKIIDELLEPRIMKLEYQEFILNEQLFVSEDATERLIRLIEGMLQYKSNPENLPVSILDNYISTRLHLKSNIGDYYPELSWLDELDKRKLELELLAARGTIKVLEQKIKNIEKRLNSVPFYALLKRIRKK